MEYAQLTLAEYRQEEEAIRKELADATNNMFRLRDNFINIGWRLEKIEFSGRHKEEGYASISEYAKAKYHMSPSDVSRCRAMYNRYTLPGNTAELKEEYKGLKKFHLEAMLDVPEEDHEMVLPEASREDIRELARFDRENENNLARLLNWGKSKEKYIEEAITELFRQRKDTLNALYASAAFRENDTEGMAKTMLKGQKHTFRAEGIFIVLYTDKTFIKTADNSHYDISWEDFFAATRKIFGPAAAGPRTWENYFAPEKGEIAPEEREIAPAQMEEEIPGQDSIMNHPEYLPENPGQPQEEAAEETPSPQGRLHKSKYPSCIYESGTECIGEECGKCEKKTAWEKKMKTMDTYIGAFAIWLIRNHKGYFEEDHTDRVQLVDKSEPALKDYLAVDREGSHSYGFPVPEKEETAYAVLFPDKVRIERFSKGGEKETVGEYEWPCLCVKIRGKWNAAFLQDAQKLLDGGQERQAGGERGQSIRHFVSDPKEDYGFSYALIVKEYLETGYMQPDKETEVRKLGANYHVLKRDKVTAFYNEAGQALFDVTNERLAQEYAHYFGDKEAQDPKETGTGRCENAAETENALPKPQPDPEGTAKTASGETAAGGQQDPGNTSYAAAGEQMEGWPRDLSDIPVPSLLVITELLEEQEEELRQYLACEGVPGRTVLKKQLITAGLRLVKNLVEDVLDGIGEELD